MAETPFELCEVAIEVRNALDEGRMADAKRIAIKHLQKGFHSQPFADVVAEMLGAERRLGVRGRKRRRYPPNWIEIGHEFRKLTKSGMKYDEIYEKLAKKYSRSERSIETARSFFEQSNEVFIKTFLRSYRNNNNPREE